MEIPTTKIITDTLVYNLELPEVAEIRVVLHAHVLVALVCAN